MISVPIKIAANLVLWLVHLFPFRNFHCIYKFIAVLSSQTIRSKCCSAGECTFEKYFGTLYFKACQMSEGVHVQLHVFWRVCKITPTGSSGALTPPRGGRLMYYIHSVGAKYYLVIYTGHFGNIPFQLFPCLSY